MNFLQIATTDSELKFGEGQSALATGKLAQLPDKVRRNHWRSSSTQTTQCNSRQSCR